MFLINKGMNEYIDRFKYGKEIASLISEGAICPTQLFEPVKDESYRFVFLNEYCKNHIPVYKQNPRRMLDSHLDTSGFALSCFRTKENAERRFFELISSNPNIFKSIGDSLSAGLIEEKDGRITLENIKGHFDLYEFIDCDLNKKFEVLYSLIG